MLRRSCSEHTAPLAARPALFHGHAARPASPLVTRGGGTWQECGAPARDSLSHSQSSAAASTAGRGSGGWWPEDSSRAGAPARSAFLSAGLTSSGGRIQRRRQLVGINQFILSGDRPPARCLPSSVPGSSWRVPACLACGEEVKGGIRRPHCIHGWTPISRGSAPGGREFVCCAGTDSALVRNPSGAGAGSCGLGRKECVRCRCRRQQRQRGTSSRLCNSRRRGTAARAMDGCAAGE